MTAPPAVSLEEQNEYRDVKEFHSKIGRLAGLSIPLKFRLMPWEFYERNLLHQEGLHPRRLQWLKEAWSGLAARYGEPQPPASRTARVAPRLATARLTPAPPVTTVVPAAVAEVPTSAAELQATTVPEFFALLRLLQQRSGLNRNQLAKATGISASTVYYLLNPRTTVLPRKIEQVKALAIACGLGEHQVRRVLELWAQLHDQDEKEAQPFGPVTDQAKVRVIRTEDSHSGPVAGQTVELQQLRELVEQSAHGGRAQSPPVCLAEAFSQGMAPALAGAASAILLSELDLGWYGLIIAVGIMLTAFCVTLVLSLRPLRQQVSSY